MTIHKQSDRSPWDYVQPWDVDLCGPQILDETQRRQWSAAFGIAGGLPYIWNELARPISEIVYGLLELGQSLLERQVFGRGHGSTREAMTPLASTVGAPPSERTYLIIGEGIAPARWDADLQALVGPEGEVRCVEIILEGRRRTMEKQRGRKGVAGTWQWAYTFDEPAASYDAVAVLQSTQHCDDWDETSAELVRVLKPGRRIVLAEAVLVGATMRHRIDSDVHLRQWYEKVLGFLGVNDIPYTSGEELRQAFDGKVESPQVMEWHGIEMFWGRKPA